MLGKMLDVIANQLNSYIGTKMEHPEGDRYVVLSNPTDNRDRFFSQGDGLYFSLLNIEEELTRRTGSVVDNGTLTSQPAVNINLQVIFIANHTDDYITELNLIYWVMSFFQSKPVFDLANTPELADCGFTGDDKLVFELNTLRLEDCHYIWGNLGMKQMPSITYLIKMLVIRDSRLSEGSVINQIELRDKS